VCYLRVNQVPYWNPHEAVNHAGTSDLSLLSHGVRVTVITGGEWKALSLNRLFVNLASCIVYLQMPRKLLFFIVVYCFGHMSKMYRGTLYEKFDLGMIVSGITARLMASSCAFAEMEEERGKGISLRRMQAAVLDVFPNATDAEGDADKGSHTLGVSDIIGFCRFANQAMRDQRIAQDQERLDHVLSSRLSSAVNNSTPSMSSAGTISTCPDAEDTYINSDMFMEAVSNSERVSFHTLVRLFDADRKMGLLERFIMPPYINKVLRDDLKRRKRFEDDEYERRAAIQGLQHTKDDVQTLHSRWEEVQKDLTKVATSSDVLLETVARLDKEVETLKASGLDTSGLSRQLAALGHKGMSAEQLQLEMEGWVFHMRVIAALETVARLDQEVASLKARVLDTSGFSQEALERQPAAFGHKGMHAEQLQPELNGLTREIARFSTRLDELTEAHRNSDGPESCRSQASSCSLLGCGNGTGSVVEHHNPSDVVEIEIHQQHPLVRVADT